MLKLCIVLTISTSFFFFYQYCRFDLTQGHHLNISITVMLYWEGKRMLTAGSTDKHILVISESTRRRKKYAHIMHHFPIHKIQTACPEMQSAKKWRGALRWAPNGTHHNKMLSKTSQWTEIHTMLLTDQKLAPWWLISSLSPIKLIGP